MAEVAPAASADTAPAAESDAWEKAATGAVRESDLVQTTQTAERYFNTKTWDERGYLIAPLASYPVGKFAFGNQAEYLLSKLAVAKDMNRCLVLPDMTDMLGTLRKPARDVRFENIFDPIHADQQQCVISVSAFLKLAERHWRHRFAFFEQSNRLHKWYDEHGISFDAGYMDDGEKRLVMFYHKLFAYNRDTPQFRMETATRRYPVLATSGAYSELPASPPVAKSQASLRFAPWIREEAAKFISANLKGRFLGIHVRNAPDWKNACNLNAVTHMVDYCSKPLTMDECHPPLEMVVREAKMLIKQHGLSSIFLAAKKSKDSESFGQRLMRALQNLGVTVATPDFDVPWIDLEILGSAGKSAPLLLHRCSQIDSVTSARAHWLRICVCAARCCRCVRWELRVYVLSIRVSRSHDDEAQGAQLFLRASGEELSHRTLRRVTRTH